MPTWEAHEEAVMKKHTRSTGYGRRFGWALATLAVVAVAPLNTLGADRMVLAEHFTKPG
jgi:hypothetical protein